MKRPDFLEGVVPATSLPVPYSSIAAGQLRSVAWAAAPAEVAAPLPMQPLSAPSPVVRSAGLGAAPPPTFTPPAPGFEVLSSATAPHPPAPMPTPPPPPPPQPVGLSPKVEAAIKELQLQGERLAQQARSDALEVGLLVARKILEREISTNHEALFALIKSAIRRVGEANRTVVRLHPDDLARVEAIEGGALSLGEVTLEADESLARGDVMVDSEHHTVDGRLGTRLDEVARTLTGEDE